MIDYCFFFFLSLLLFPSPHFVPFLLYSPCLSCPLPFPLFSLFPSLIYFSTFLSYSPLFSVSVRLYSPYLIYCLPLLFSLSPVSILLVSHACSPSPFFSLFPFLFSLSLSLSPFSLFLSLSFTCNAVTVPVTMALLPIHAPPLHSPPSFSVFPLPQSSLILPPTRKGYLLCQRTNQGG